MIIDHHQSQQLIFTNILSERYQNYNIAPIGNSYLYNILTKHKTPYARMIYLYLKLISETISPEMKYTTQFVYLLLFTKRALSMNYTFPEKVNHAYRAH